MRSLPAASHGPADVGHAHAAVPQDGGFSRRLSTVQSAGCDDGAGTIQLGMPSQPERPAPRASACVLPFSDLDIWADGKAVVCCQDWNEEYVIGDMSTESLAEIWLGERRGEVRRLHLERRGHELGLCAKCDCWIEPSRGTRLWK